MHILHLYKDYFPVLGGIENHIRVLAEGSVARGHVVTVLVTSLDRQTRVETLNGVRLVKTARWANLASTPLSPAMFGRARSLGRVADVVHLHFPYPPGEVAHLLSGSRAKTVLTYHSDIVRQKNLLRVYRPLMWRVLRRVNRIIATSPRYLETSTVLNRFWDKCCIIPLGVEVERFAAADPGRVAALRRQLIGDAAPPGPAHVLLSVGRLRYYKGLDTLIRALPHLPSARCVVVGTGPMEAEWRRLAASLQVADRVTFAGDVPDAELPAYYHAADVYVLPAAARAEAFGVAVVEAMAAGLPCVTTEVGSGTSWVVQDGVTGYVIPPRDPAALGQALAPLLDDAERRTQLGWAAAQRARAEFDQRVMIERVLNLYAALLGKDEVPDSPPPAKLD